MSAKPRKAAAPAATRRVNAKQRAVRVVAAEEIEPGPRATPQQARSANIEALDLLVKIERLNLPRAADYIRGNPPTAEAIASLAFVLLRVVRSAAAQRAGKSPRPKSLRERMRKAGYNNYAEAIREEPGLRRELSKKQLMDAISKAKRRR